MPKNFDQVTAFSAKNVKIAGMRIALQLLLNLQRQAVHAFAHLGTADCQPATPAPRSEPGHRRANASTTAAAKAGDTAAGIRTLALPAKSISIAGIGGGAVTPSPAGATSTRAKPFAAARRSRRPTVDQARRHVGLTRYITDHCTRFKRRCDNRLLLLHAPPATPLGTGQDLEACHCTVSCTGANTDVCTGPYQPDHFTDRKTAFGGGSL